jgi:hypothetical protein
MKVSRDKYELPEAVAGTVKELALLLGIKENTVIHYFHLQRKYGMNCGYVKVEIDEEEDDE